MTAPSHTSETIERELAALGEAPPSAEELAMLAADEPVDDQFHGPSGPARYVVSSTGPTSGPVGFVARLVELAEPLAFDDLSELESHRGWRNVEQRLARPVATRPLAEPHHHGGEPQNHGGGAPRWLLAAVGIAAAAAIVLVVVWPANPNKTTIAQTEPLDPEQVAALGDQARATLAALDDGATDTQRAERSAAAYQALLDAQREELRR